MLATIRNVARRLLGEQTWGALQYYRHPEQGDAWGGPFNGQPNRIGIFQSIIATVRPVAIVETGTYLGTTTEFMARTGLPVYTVESQPRAYGFARARLRRLPNVSIDFGDSRVGLRSFFRGPLSSKSDRTIFAYLDAHWRHDLPLAEEIDIIFFFCRGAVVMIDDFQVPGDPGYAYDDFGEGKALTPAYIGAAVNKHALRAFYPSLPSSQEGGERRGCVVLAKEMTLAKALAASAVLKAA